jgi:NAD(P)-dependent dehydrogenase (short-subunit alcohol dehydrogenase family)
MKTPKEGAVAIITGAGRGIGEATAYRYAEAGMSLLILDKDGAAAETVAAAIRASGGRAVSLAIDLRDEDAPGRMVRATIDAFGRIDVLVNNAGIAPLIGFLETTREQLRELMAINFEMQFTATQAVVRQLIDQGEGGCIINLGTVNALVGVNRTAAYAGSKGALIAFTRALAVELAPHQIRVNALAPGTIRTARVVAALTEDDFRRRIERIPAGRLGTEADVTGCALFLVGPDAGFVNGHVLVADGGFSILGTF